MSLALKKIVIDGETDTRLVMGNSQFGAVLSNVGSTWYRLRLGGRICFDPLAAGAALSGTPYFMIGAMCGPSSSMQNGPTTNFCTNFVGIRSNTAAWGQISQSVDSPAYYNWVSSSGFRVIHRAGAAEQIGSTGMGAVPPIGRYISADTASRNAFMMEIVKVGYPVATAFTCSIMFASSSTFLPDVSYASMSQAMELHPFSSADAYLSGSYFFSNGNVVCDESSGSLNAIVIAWSFDFAKMYLSEFLWKKFDS